MAYVSQEMKAAKAPTVKSICKKYGISASLAVRNHSTLVLNIKSGGIDFIGNVNETSIAAHRHDRPYYQPAKDHVSVNVYHFKDHFTGKAKDFLTEVIDAMNVGNHDRSDIQTDYFDVGFYVDVNIGRWDKPYQLVK